MTRGQFYLASYTVAPGRDMFTPQRLLRVVIELLFVLLGALVIWLGLSGQALEHGFNPGKPSWLILSVVIIAWGVRALLSRRTGSAAERWARGLSLVLLGAVMLVISRAPVRSVGPLVAMGGLVLGARGLVSLALLLRPAASQTR